MGQAKHRGTPEQRKQAAIERDARAVALAALAKEEADRAKAEHLASLPPEEQARLDRQRARAVAALGWVASSIVPPDLPEILKGCPQS